MPCASCGTLIVVDDEYHKASELSEEELLPKNISVTKTDDTIEIAYKWFSKKHLSIFIVAICYLSFYITVDIFLLRSGLSWVGMVHIFIATGFIYWAVAGFINKTVITISRIVNIKSGPLPWYGNRRFLNTQLKQIYVIQKKRSLEIGGTKYLYEIHAKLTNGWDIKLLGMISLPEQALYIEQEMEKYLSINDRRVEDDFKIYY